MLLLKVDVCLEEVLVELSDFLVFSIVAGLNLLLLPLEHPERVQDESVLARYQLLTVEVEVAIFAHLHRQLLGLILFSLTDLCAFQYVHPR